MVRIYRTMRMLSLRDLSAETKIGHATLMRIEHGQAFDVETFLKLWKWLSEAKS
jgi:transcriptional regulator with XRE-family HTH domain